MKKVIENIGSMIIFVQDENSLPPVPVECPVCHQIIDSIDSITSYRTFQCCSWCKLKWVDRDKEAWHNGKRPSQLEISAAMFEIST